MNGGNNREEKSLRHVSMVAKFLDLIKLWFCKYCWEKKKKKLICITFLCMLHSGSKRQLVLFFHRSTMQIAVSLSLIRKITMVT